MPLAPEAQEVWMDAHRRAWYNPSALYRGSLQVSVLLDEVRERVAEYLQCVPGCIVFNSGATEGNNTFFHYVQRVFPQEGILLLSKGEHPSVYASIQSLFPGRYEWLEHDVHGRVDLEALEQRLKRGGCVSVSVLAANNESGLLQPWRELADLCKRYQVWYHCDATQWLGKLPARGLGACDFVTVSAHKLGGPKGAGFIKIPQACSLVSLLGGGQEMGHRSGTENYPGIASMVRALEIAQDHASKGTDARAKWRDAFEGALLKAIPKVEIVGRGAERLWNTSLCLMPGYDGVQWARKLDRAGFCVGVGSACSSAKETASSMLLQLGYSERVAKGAIRISSGWSTQEGDWQALLGAIQDIWVERNAHSADTSLVDIDTL